MNHQTHHQKTRIEQQAQNRARVRNQLLFWSTVVVTVLNGVLLLVFRPQVKSGSDSEIVSLVSPLSGDADNHLTALMTSYIGAPARERSEILGRMLGMALSPNGRDSTELSVLHFMLEVFRSETPWSREWEQAYEAVIRLGQSSDHQRKATEVSLLHIFNEPSKAHLRASVLNALGRIDSRLALTESLTVLQTSSLPSLRREALDVIGRFAIQRGDVKAIDTIIQIAERDYALRATALNWLVVLKKPVSLSVLRESFARYQSSYELKSALVLARWVPLDHIRDDLEKISQKTEIPIEIRIEVERLLGSYRGVATDEELARQSAVNPSMPSPTPRR